jgi:hypothetical protein
MRGFSQTIHAINGAVATTTSPSISIEGAEKVSLLFTRSNHSSGSTAFSVTVSLDGITFVAYNRLVSNVANTNAQTILRVDSVSLASNTSSLVMLDPNDGFKAMKVTATETTDGTHDATVFIQY